MSHSDIHDLPAPTTAEIEEARAAQQAAAAAFSAMLRRPHTMIEFYAAQATEARAYVMLESLKAQLPWGMP